MGHPIRVLQIVTQMNRGGMESRLMDIYRNIDRKKVQFDFYTCRSDKGYFDEEIRSLNGKVYYNKSLSAKSVLTIPTRFKSFFKEHPEYRIVHCHLNQWSGLVLAGAKNAGIPVRIAHSRTSLESGNSKNNIKNIIKIPVNYTATHKFAVSKKAGEWLFGEKAVINGKVQIWSNAIDCRKFRFNLTKRAEMREDLKLEDASTLMHVGNIRSEKNHMFLLRVFFELKKTVPNAKLMIVGADNMNNIIQNESKKLGLSQDTLFLGARSDVPDLLQAGDIFVFPSLYEGFPGAVLEAQSAGLPCIISDTITDEVCLTNNIIQLPIDKGVNSWVDQILKYKDIARQDTYDELVKAGYDIETLCRDLTYFYQSCVGE